MSHHLLKRLHRLKEQKQEFALKAVEAMRGDVERARADLTAAQDALHASTASYGGRVDALYAPLLGTTTDLSAIEAVEGRIAELDLEHERLADNLNEASDYLVDLEERLQDLSAAYAEAARTTDKFAQLLGGITIEVRKEEERLEEIEIEEGFTNRQEMME
jgi:predicted  nucleic acid-binding Zn-ribbon protein